MAGVVCGETYPWLHTWEYLNLMIVHLKKYVLLSFLENEL